MSGVGDRPHARSSALALGTVGSRGLAVGFAFCTSVLATRALGPADRGRYSVLVTIAVMATSIGHLSVEHGQISLWREQRLRGAMRSNAPALGLVLGSVSAVLAALVSLHGPPVILSGVPTHLLVVALLGVPLGTAALYLNSVLVLDGRIKVVNLAALAAAAAQLAAVTVLWLTDRITVFTVLVAWLLAVLVPAAFAAVAIRPSLSMIDLQGAMTTVRTGVKYHPGMVSLVLLLQVDILMTNALSSTFEVGIYSLAVQIGTLAFLISDSVSQVALTDQTTAPLQESASLTAQLVRINSFLLVLTLVPLAAISFLAVPFVYGAEFRQTALALLLLSPGILALGAARAAGGFLVRMDRPACVTGIYLSALVLNVALNFGLIPQLGATGAAISSTVSYGLVLVLSLVWLASATDLHARAFLIARSDLRQLVDTAMSFVRLVRGRASTRHRRTK